MEQENIVILFAEVALVVASYLLLIVLKMINKPARERIVTVVPARVRR